MELAVSRLPARKKFQGFKGEAGKRLFESKSLSKPTENIGILMEAWEKHAASLSRPESNPYSGGPHPQVELELDLFRTNITAQEIEQLSILLKQFEGIPGFESAAGNFLSGLINISSSESFILHTRHFRFPLFGLGNSSSKHITIDGPAGDWAGAGMKGTMIVEGKVRDGAGIRSEGRLVICGDAGMLLGQNMKENGIIEIEGEFESLGENIKGKIYHRGKQII